MSRIISDFLQVGTLRFVARVLMGLRGLYIVANLSPYVLGEYTVWLLFVFYFSVLDFGVLAGLERDIPHYRGSNDRDGIKKCSDAGWSAFFFLSAGASLALGVVSFMVFGRGTLAVLLAAYMLTDKIYRAFDAGSRIDLRYKENGIAQLINALVSLLIIAVFLPSWGPYGILVGFIAAGLGSTLFLSKSIKIVFDWSLKVKEMFAYIKKALALAVIVYSIQFYHMIALTVLALLYDKTTLGYFAFAFRIFQIFLAIFPFLIQEIMRTRMYFHAAQRQGGRGYLETLFYPMGVYCLVTSFFWILVYWWGDWGIGWLAPEYPYSVGILKLLTLALMPLGIAKICSDYLCSNVHQRMKDVAMLWLSGILFQVAALFFIAKEHLLLGVPAVYLVATFAIYVMMAKFSMDAEGAAFPEDMKLMYFWVPQIMALLTVYGWRELFHSMPSRVFSSNMIPCLFTCLITFFLIYGMIRILGKQDRFKAFFVRADR